MIKRLSVELTGKEEEKTFYKFKGKCAVDKITMKEMLIKLMKGYISRQVN